MPIYTEMYKPMPLASLHAINVEKHVLELKVLPSHLKYAFLDDLSSFPVIISSALNSVEEEKLLRVLRDHKSAIGWCWGLGFIVCCTKYIRCYNFRTKMRRELRKYDHY